MKIKAVDSRLYKQIKTNIQTLHITEMLTKSFTKQAKHSQL